VDEVYVSEVYGTVCGKNFERGVSLMEIHKTLGRCMFCVSLAPIFTCSAYVAANGIHEYIESCGSAVC
jgi:hypothetical protein